MQSKNNSTCNSAGIPSTLRAKDSKHGNNPAVQLEGADVVIVPGGNLGSYCNIGKRFLMMKELT